MSDYTEGGDGFPERLCSREGKVMDVFVLVISISIWSAPWNNKMVTVH